MDRFEATVIFGGIFVLTLMFCAVFWLADRHDKRNIGAAQSCLVAGGVFQEIGGKGFCFAVQKTPCAETKPMARSARLK